MGCQLASHYLPTTTHGPENDRFLHKLANEELTTEMLTLYDVDFPEDVPSLADAEDFLLGLLPSLKVLRTKKAVKGSIRSHDDITADTEEDQKQKLQRAGKKLARDLEIFSDWFLEQTASLTEHERRAKAWESKRRDAAKQVILSIVEKSLAVSKSTLASLASEAPEKARQMHEDWGLRSCFIRCFVLLPTEGGNKQQQTTTTTSKAERPLPTNEGDPLDQAGDQVRNRGRDGVLSLGLCSRAVGGLPACPLAPWQAEGGAYIPP